MRPRRLVLVLVALVLLLGGSLPHTPAARAVGGWTESAAPGGNAATLLADGRVLITRVVLDEQGFPSGQATDVYDPATDQSRRGAPFGLGEAPVLLPDGAVLFTGGPSGFRNLSNGAVVYDPTADAWTTVAPMSTVRIRHTATALPDGTILVVGGGTTQGSSPTSPTEVVERFDPQTRRWSRAAPLRPGRESHTATLLPDGRLLVTGGYTGEQGSYRETALAALYDPRTDTWAAAGSMAVPRIGHQATLLRDGRVLVTGGTRYETAGRITYAEAEIYDPATNRWMPTAPLLTARRFHGAVPLPDGRVLVVGGVGPIGGDEMEAASLTSAELYDPARNLWAPAAPLLRPTSQRALLLRDGRVLVGGQLYAPTPEPTACFAATGRCVRGRFLDHWLASGGLARHGLPLSDERIETLEDGRAYQVQYFERSRLEYHAADAPPGDVLLGQFGRRIHPADAPVAARAGATFFPQTGHNVEGRFLAYWAAGGGLASFGYPLGEERSETLEDGNAYTVQYFERARFEYHPEHADPVNQVQLGQLGRRILAEVDAGRP